MMFRILKIIQQLGGIDFDIRGKMQWENSDF